MSGHDPNERLLEAVRAEDPRAVSAALDQGADANAKYGEGDDVLGVAVLSGNAENVQRLLRAGANPNARRWDGHFSLYWAARKSRPDLLRQLLAAGARVAAELDRESETSVHAAAEQNNVELLEPLFVADGASAVNAFDYISRTPLIRAVRAGNMEAASFLLEHGADVNAHDEARSGDTALHDAASSGTYEMVKLLMDAGADPTIEGWMRLTPLDKASSRTDELKDSILHLLRSRM
jgi:ankyrin repeat protein